MERVPGRVSRSSWGYLEVNSSETLPIFGDKCPQNGSKNDLIAPRTTMECPHQGPYVVSLGGWASRTASERRGNTLQDFVGFYLEAKAKNWPGLFYE
jgi:hypothetical protein